MAYSLQLSLPTRVFRSPRKIDRKNPCYLHIVFSSSQSNPHGEEEDNGRVQGQVILVERYGNGTSKRYLLNEESQLQTLVEEHDSVNHSIQLSKFSRLDLSLIPDTVKDFILPAGFPGSVSDDYLEYMLLQFPTNVTAWICHTLVTSSLLKARQSNSGQ